MGRGILERILGLNRSDADRVAIGASEVVRLEAEGDVVGLIHMLNSPLEASERRTVRGYAALALGHVGDERAVEPLIRILDDVRPTVRMLAASSLGEIGHNSASIALTKTLQDPVPMVRIASAMSLGRITRQESTEVLAPLRNALADPNPLVRVFAADALVGEGLSHALTRDDYCRIRNAEASDSWLRFGRRRQWNRILNRLKELIAEEPAP